MWGDCCLFFEIKKNLTRKPPSLLHSFHCQSCASFPCLSQWLARGMESGQLWLGMGWRHLLEHTPLQRANTWTGLFFKILLKNQYFKKPSCWFIFIYFIYSLYTCYVSSLYIYVSLYIHKKFSNGFKYI